MDVVEKMSAEVLFHKKFINEFLITTTTGGLTQA
jgi:hypothetical protein